MADVNTPISSGGGTPEEIGIQLQNKDGSKLYYPVSLDNKILFTKDNNVTVHDYLVDVNNVLFDNGGLYWAKPKKPNTPNTKYTMASLANDGTYHDENGNTIKKNYIVRYRLPNLGKLVTVSGYLLIYDVHGSAQIAFSANNYYKSCSSTLLSCLKPHDVSKVCFGYKDADESGLYIDIYITSYEIARIKGVFVAVDTRDNSDNWNNSTLIKPFKFVADTNSEVNYYKTIELATTK